MAQIAGSIREWGWTIPVLVDEGGGIIAGHGRVLAALKLGLADVPVMVARGWSEAQRRAYVIADNKLAENADWDLDKLRVEMGDLAAEGFELDLIGFDEVELTDLLSERTEGLTDPDDAPELPADPISRLGDIWLPGRHRVVCGDSTSADSIRAALDGRSADVCLTDPPYGLGASETTKNNYDVYDDGEAGLAALIDGFLPLAQANAPLVVLTPGNGNQWRYPRPTWTMAWFTPAGVGRGPWGFCCWQPVLCYGKDPKLSRGKGCRPDALVHTETSEKSAHPCPKPVNLWAWLVERVTEDGAVILEPFLGSGTALIAAEMTGRRVSAVELSPAYVDVAIRRWQAFTGQDATLDGDGRSFAEIEWERTDAGGQEAEIHEAAEA